MTSQTPDLLPVIQQTASAFRHLLLTNTYESCLEFTQRVLMACGDPEWGHVGKTSGEGQSVPPGFTPQQVVIRRTDGQRDTITITGVSHDAIFHRLTNQIVDILGNASANSESDLTIHGPAVPQWGLVPKHLNRVNNPWLPTILVGGSTPARPNPAPAPVTGAPAYPENEADVDAAGEALFADFKESGQAPNPQMFRFAFRTAYDWVSKSEPSLAASVEKHRATWRKILGLPPRT